MIKKTERLPEAFEYPTHVTVWQVHDLEPSFTIHQGDPDKQQVVIMDLEAMWELFESIEDYL